MNLEQQLRASVAYYEQKKRRAMRAQLVACTEAPRFPVVTRGSC